MSDPQSDGIERSVTDYLRANFLYTRPDFPLSGETALLEHGVVDSLGIIELIEFLQEQFGIRVADDEIIEENLGTVNRIAGYVRQKRRVPA